MHTLSLAGASEVALKGSHNLTLRHLGHSMITLIKGKNKIMGKGSSLEIWLKISFASAHLQMTAQHFNS